MLRQDLHTRTGVGVVQGLESQVCQRYVPLAFVLLVATGRWPKKGKDYKEEENKRTQIRSEIWKNTLPIQFLESPEDKAINIQRKGTNTTSLKNQNHHNRWRWCGRQILYCICAWYIVCISIFYLFGEQQFFKLLLFKLNRWQRFYLIWIDVGKIGHFLQLVPSWKRRWLATVLLSPHLRRWMGFMTNKTLINIPRLAASSLPAWHLHQIVI